MPALVLDDVSQRYAVGDATVVALDGVDLTVGDGEVVALVGPSGSGKSTALAIAGALRTPTSGRAIVDGIDVSTLSQRRRTAFRRTGIGFVFQALNLVPFLTARENLLVIGGRGAGVRARADDLLAELGLSQRADSRAAQLSGGERQRVAIGRALMHRPGLLLVDEPTSALDTERGLEVMALLREEMRRHGAAGVVVTHDARMVEVCDRVVTIRDGRISDDGAVAPQVAAGDGPVGAGRAAS